MAEYWIEVTEGPDKGKRFDLKNGTTVIGRSSACTVALADPVLSRIHCRVERNGGSLRLIDMDSANGTAVNGKECRESPLAPGDRIEIGETAMQVGSSNSAAEEPSEAGVPIVDLGFDDKGEPGSDAARPNWRPLLWAIAAAAVLSAAAAFILDGGAEPAAPEIAPPPAPPVLPLLVSYEKIEADAANIFRYSMEISAAGELSVSIDDLSENRHVRKNTRIPDSGLERLAHKLEKAGVFAVESPAAGVSQGCVLARRSLVVVSGERVAKIAVENRTPPEAFSDVCEILETFGKNELGIWAIQYPAEKLVELAHEAFTRAQNLYEQRGIAHGNVHSAIRAYREAAFYLETIEPKPDFYPDMLTGLSEAEALLKQRYEEQLFNADRAINLKDWQSAAEMLRILREQIPDEDDPRNAEATRKLLDVENRLKKAKGGK